MRFTNPKRVLSDHLVDKLELDTNIFKSLKIIIYTYIYVRFFLVLLNDDTSYETARPGVTPKF